MSQTCTENKIYDYEAPLNLNFTRSNETVTVVPEDADLFHTTVGKVIEACKAYKESEEFQKQFNSVLNRLAEWIDENSSYINCAFLTIRDSILLFLVVKKDRTYDGDFEDRLTKLDMDIAKSKDFNKINLNVLALPDIGNHAINTFLSPKMTLKYNI